MSRLCICGWRMQNWSIQRALRNFILQAASRRTAIKQFIPLHEVQDRVSCWIYKLCERLALWAVGGSTSHTVYMCNRVRHKTRLTDIKLDIWSVVQQAFTLRDKSKGLGKWLSAKGGLLAACKEVSSRSRGFPSGLVHELHAFWWDSFYAILNFTILRTRCIWKCCCKN